MGGVGYHLAFLADRARFIRLEAIRLTSRAGSGHLGSTLGDADLLSVLYYHTLRVDPARPYWRDRDRLILSKGHVAMGIYPVLADLGFFPLNWLDHYGEVASGLADHPDMRRVPGLDFSGGSLGHGLSIAVGMALAGRLDRRAFRVFCLLGDGELAEGQVWEAFSAATQFELSNLIALVDRNGMSLDGPTEQVMGIEPLRDRLDAFGWEVREVDGHDISGMVKLFDALGEHRRGHPVAVIVRTVKGKGVPAMEGDPAWHLGGLSPEDAQGARRALGEPT